tara:strand:- start:1398 stop:2093 length:696 start_codon:yes stop_codon:yes gene_type:complete
MATIVNTPAIVLRSFPYGDTSIIARCFTKEKGKTSLIIKGARSKKSPKAAQFQPLSYIDIIYNHKANRDLHILSKVQFREYWPHIIEDLRSVTLSFAILEMTEKTLLDDDPHPNLFFVLESVLSAFNARESHPNLLFWFYECALLSHLGFKPNFDEKGLPGLTIVDPNSGPNSGIILASLLAENINELPKENITSKDQKIISNYLWTLLCYHFDGLKNIKSMDVARKILNS